MIKKERKFKLGDTAEVLNFRHHRMGNSPHPCFWVRGMDKYIGQIVKVYHIHDSGSEYTYKIKDGENYDNFIWAGEWLKSNTWRFQDEDFEI